MFNFFFETAKAVIAPSTSSVIEKIHNDFDTASQKAVDEAKKIIDGFSNPATEKQVALLKAAGFTSMPVVTEWDEQNKKRTGAQFTMSIVEKYAQKYPGQKFIFLGQVKDICKKYGLLCVPVGKYKGTVPQKNIEEITSFEAQPEDTYLEENGTFTDRMEFDFSKRGRFRNKAEYSTLISEAHRLNTQSLLSGYLGYRQQVSYHAPVPMFICAPKGDIVVGKDDKVSNDVFMTREIKDPIVLHYVGDGFLVVSKWGLEASDKSLVNEKMN